MDAIVGSIANIWKYKPKTRIDNIVFSLHKLTAGIIFFFSLLISSGFLISDPIQCISDKTVERVINAYCWIHSTYTLPDKLNGNRSQVDVAHPGVATYYPEEDTIKVHKYYQWVCFALFFQALAFYFPRWLWGNWEEGRIKSHSVITRVDLVMDDEALEARKVVVQKYFCSVMGTNDPWSMKFAFCEVLNFINVVIQIDFTDRFTGRAFSTYGLHNLIQFRRQDPMYRTDALAVAFPMVSKCTLNAYGPSGNIIPYDAMCVLPFNMYNEKFYPILWLWFIILAVISGLALVYRLATFLSPELRYQILRRKFQLQESELDHIWNLNRILDYGDWFLLFNIGKNMGPATFLDFLDGLAKRALSEHSYYKDNISIDDKPAPGKKKFV